MGMSVTCIHDKGEKDKGEVPGTKKEVIFGRVQIHAHLKGVGSSRGNVKGA